MLSMDMCLTTSSFFAHCLLHTFAEAEACVIAWCLLLLMRHSGLLHVHMKGQSKPLACPELFTFSNVDNQLRSTQGLSNASCSDVSHQWAVQM